MTICSKCGHENTEDTTFCTNCGSRLVHSRTAEPKGRKKSMGKPVLIVALVLVLAAAFTGYKLMEKKYSSEAAAAQFIEALEEKNTPALKKLIQPTDSRIAVNDQSIQHLLALLDENPAFIQEIEQAFENEDQRAPFFMNEAGRKYGLFKEYAVDANPYFLSVSVEGSNALLSIDGEKAGEAEKDETVEKGPYLAGLYTVEGTNEEKKTNISEEVLLKGDESSVPVQLVMPASEEKETVQVPVPEKEVVFVPAESSDGYILPHSGYTYLSGSDLSGLSDAMLRLARNEIYARHGYIFQSDELQAYFNGMSWYEANPYYDGSLTSVEKANVEFIQSYE